MQCGHAVIAETMDVTHWIQRIGVGAPTCGRGQTSCHCKTTADKRLKLATSAACWESCLTRYNYSSKVSTSRLEGARITASVMLRVNNSELNPARSLLHADVPHA